MSPEPDPTLRASDADRDAVAERLREAHAEGRLTVDEVGERLDATFAARTLGELRDITRDLPQGSGRVARTGDEAEVASPAAPARWSVRRRPARCLGYLGDRGAGDVSDLVRQRPLGHRLGFYWPVGSPGRERRASGSTLAGRR